MDGNGGISLEELSQGLAEQGYAVTPMEVEQLMTRLDLDADGHIQIDEFAASMIDWRDVSPLLSLSRGYCTGSIASPNLAHIKIPYNAYQHQSTNSLEGFGSNDLVHEA